MDFELYSLANGIKVVHRRVSSPVANCCIMVNAGTRDEREDQHGIAHFIEHAIFKGTTKRKAYHVLSRLENVGGELNAYTAKEETVVYATVLKHDFARAVELLTDIVFQSTFPDKELQKEKDVVFDEINSYKDSPAELIYDEFEGMVYKNHPLGHNILGTKRIVKRFDQKAIHAFMAANYNTDQLVFCSVGDIPFNRVKALANRYLGDIPTNRRLITRPPFNNYVPEHRVLNRATHQVHCVLGAPVYSLFDPNRHALFLLTNILGGPNLNSRLNIALRERHGYAYSVEASYQPYTDTGLFTIYFGADRTNLDHALELVMRELDLLKTKPLGSLQLTRAKRQLTGQMAIAAESNESLMLSAAKGFLVYETPEELEQAFEIIDRITADDLLRVANEVFETKNLSSLIYR